MSLKPKLIIKNVTVKPFLYSQQDVLFVKKKISNLLTDFTRTKTKLSAEAVLYVPFMEFDTEEKTVDSPDVFDTSFYIKDGNDVYLYKKYISLTRRKKLLSDLLVLLNPTDKARLLLFLEDLEFGWID